MFHRNNNNQNHCTSSNGNKQNNPDNTKNKSNNTTNQNNFNNNNNIDILCLEKSTISFSDENSSYILSSDPRPLAHNAHPSEQQKTYESYVSASRESNQNSVYSDLSVIRTEEGLEMNLSANFEKPCEEDLGFWNNLKKNFVDYKNILKFNIIQTEHEIKLEDFPALTFFGKKYVNEKFRFSGNLVEQRTFNALKNEILWFCYRKNFENLVYEKTIYTSDAGWGCMIRSGQMILAKAIIEFYKIQNSCGFCFDKKNKKNLPNYKSDNYFLNTLLLFMDNSLSREEAREYQCFSYLFSEDTKECLTEGDKQIEDPKDLLFHKEKSDLNINCTFNNQNKKNFADEKSKGFVKGGKNEGDFLVIIDSHRQIKNYEIDEDYMDNRINLDNDYIENKNKKKNNNNYINNTNKQKLRQNELLLKDSKENKNLNKQNNYYSSNNIYTKIKEDNVDLNEKKDWASQIKLNDEEELEELEDNDLFAINKNNVSKNRKSKSNNRLNENLGSKKIDKYPDIDSSDNNRIIKKYDNKDADQKDKFTKSNKQSKHQKKITPPFSIKNICDYSYKFNKGAGMWFSNNMIINILKDINDDKQPLPSLKIKHFDSIIKQKEIYSEFFEKISCTCEKDAHYIGSIYTTNVGPTGFSDYISINQNEAKEEFFSECNCFSDKNLVKFEGNFYMMKTAFAVFISMRLGLSSLEPNYFKGLLEVFDLPNNLGVIGGKGSKAIYFIGKRNEKHLIYVDPHYVQESDLSVWSVKNKIENYKANKFFEIKIEDCTPSLTAGFFCGKPTDFKELCEIISKSKLVSEIIKVA